MEAEPAGEGASVDACEHASTPEHAGDVDGAGAHGCVGDGDGAHEPDGDAEGSHDCVGDGDGEGTHELGGEAQTGGGKNTVDGRIVSTAPRTPAAALQGPGERTSWLDDDAEAGCEKASSGGGAAAAVRPKSASRSGEDLEDQQPVESRLPLSGSCELASGVSSHDMSVCAASRPDRAGAGAGDGEGDGDDDGNGDGDGEGKGAVDGEGDGEGAGAGAGEGEGACEPCGRD